MQSNCQAILCKTQMRSALQMSDGAVVSYQVEFYVVTWLDPRTLF